MIYFKYFRYPRTDLLLDIEALVLVDGPALPVLHSLTLEALHGPALLAALRLTEAHGRVVRHELPHQAAVPGPTVGPRVGQAGHPRHHHHQPDGEHRGAHSVPATREQLRAGQWNPGYYRSQVWQGLECS